MMKPYAKLLRAFMFALMAAGGFTTAVIVAQGVCGNPLACFEPGQEGEIWQALTPFGQINDSPACTNSEPTAARIREDSRQCTRNDEQPIPAPYPVLMPPSLGQFLDPFALAVDGERIYISDQSNHRIQVMKFDGTPIKIAYPIGDGVAGEGPYPAYPADSRMTGNGDPITGQRLYSPDGLAVDATGTLVVGDYSGYINVFNPDGSPAFGTMASPERLQIIDTVDGLGNLGTKASGIAMTPGTVVRGFQVAVPVDDTSRIVVTDRLNCFIYIYDSGFNLKRQIPEVVSPDAYQGACVYDEAAAPLGVFSAPVAAAIDTLGHIYISDYDNNRIQILDLEGNPLGEFGRELLQYPWGVVVDHKGRVAVADTENQRLAFFTVDYSGASPVASYVFELDAKGTLNGYPTAIAEQVGTGPGLDPAGRFLATDTLNNRIQRFQLPDLAIINKSIDPGGFGSFQVVVPDGKAAPVTFVGVSAVGIGAAVLSINGVDPGNSVPLDPTNTALQNATAALGTTIAPGQIVSYNFTFAIDPGQSLYSFALNAVGNGGETSADRQDVDARLPCLDCLSTHQVFVAPGAPTVLATLTGGWYNTTLTVRINATTTDPAGLSGIGYQFMSGPESSSQRWGGGIYIAPVSGNAAFFDVGVQSQGVSALRYWAIGADGTVESSRPLTLRLDLSTPDVVFNIPAANDAGWNNTAVSATYRVYDGPSGPAAPTTGNLSFPSEGRLQFQLVTASDLAGNVAVDVASHLSSRAGRYLNIDKTAPILTPPADLNITIFPTGPGFAVAPASFVATAVDPPLVDARPGADLTGSGVVVLLNPGLTQFPVGQTTPFTFTATDAAGNTSTVTASVTVRPRVVTVTARPTAITYGDAEPTFDFDYGEFPAGYSAANVTSAPSCGVAGPHSDAGNYTITCSGGTVDANVIFSYAPASFSVARKNVTLVVDDKSRTFGSANPALTAVAGGLVAGDTLNYTLATAATTLTPVGGYPITAALGTNPNYNVAVTNGTLTIGRATATVTANPASKTYGEANPALDAVVAGALPGAPISYSLATSATQLSGVGSYPITVILGANPNYDVTVVPATLTIAPKTATVTAGNALKLVGTLDPALPVSGTGFLLGDAVVLSATRAIGEAVGTYTITPRVTGASVGNYTIAFVTGVFTITDNRPPVCGTASGGEIWPPNHKRFYAAPVRGVVDPDGDAVTILVTGIWQDELIDSTGDGKFSPDGNGVGTSTAWVRAERNGHGNKAPGNGRVYEILFTATDNRGAQCTGSVLYSVPHDQGQRPEAIDSGVRYDSTGVVPGARDKWQIHRNSPLP